MPPAFDLRQLRYFVTVAECGSFRAAADRLHVSQPPLSRQVAALEDTLGARLFDRHPAGVSLTAAGREALASAQGILAASEALAASFRAARRARQAPLRIGVTAALETASRQALTAAWRRALPGQSLDVETGFSRDLLPALKQGRLDFGLVGLPGDTAGLETRDVLVTPLVAALPATHPLARKKRVSLLEADGLPFFWIPRSHNTAYFDHCARFFQRIGFRPGFVTVEPGLIQTLERIAQGEGWATPNRASLATKVKGVAYRELAEGDDLAVRVAAAWKTGHHEAQAQVLAQEAAAMLGAPARGPTRPTAGPRARKSTCA